MPQNSPDSGQRYQWTFMAIVGVVRNVWLFTRGPQSVRIIRASMRGSRMNLLIEGPGPAAATLEFHDVMSCMRYQADVERHLVADGYTLERVQAERRSGQDRRRTPRDAPDRRRQP
jgi:hypothetical protein